LSRKQFQFIQTDPDDIISWMTAKYEAFTGVTVQPGSPERLFIQWTSAGIIQERALANYAANQNLPSRAEGSNLDALSELVYIDRRPEAKPASCTMRFTISEPQAFSVLVPSGTRITDASSTLIWETIEDAYVEAGETYVDVEARCQTTGTAGNGYVAGQINAIVDLFAYYQSCANVNESDGGSDIPTDEEYYKLLRASMDAYSCAGARGAYIYWAMQVSTEIADVIANSPTPGIVKVYVLMKGGTLAGEEIKGKVLAACSADEVRPLTDWVSVEDAEIVPYDIDLTYYVHQHASQSGAAIAAAVQRAVEEYIAWQSAKLGRDINPSKLTSLLMQTGIKRVDIRSPVFTSLRDGNLALSADMSYDASLAVPQLAQAGGVNIMNGGYEDE